MDFLMFGMPGGWEWFIILIIALLIFGPRLPSVMRSLGKGITEFKKGIHDVEDDLTTDVRKPLDDTKADDDKQDLQG